jgi:general secretion pathway protein H
MTSPSERAIRPRPRDCAARGFTLIELVVALAVLGLALVLITGYKPPWSRGLGLDGTARELAAQLRLARSQAIVGNRTVFFDIDLAGHRYRVGTDAPHPLPAEYRIALLTVAGEKAAPTAGGIRFNPDGSSTGGRITLALAKREVAVGVDWLTGRVRIADLH